MADISWRQGGPAQADTGILDVLIAFVSQGGLLYGARRWADNPLTITNVRWQGTNGAMLDAFRRPGTANSPDDAESKVWVQIALHFPATHPSPAGADAPWLPMNIQPAEASQWVQLIRQHQAQPQQFSRPPLTPSPERSYPPRWQNNSTGNSSDSGRYQSQQRPGFGNEEQRVPYYPSIPQPPSMPPTPTMSGRPQEYSSPPGGARYDQFEQSDVSQSQWTGNTARAALDEAEVAVVPCIEVELPPLLHNQLANDYYRDFARDIAVHFRQAMYQIREVREVRGWMRGDRMVLAARFVLGTGTQPPSRSDMERIAQTLAAVLAQRTLPYTQLGFANPGEWMQGRPLPEA